VRWLWPAHSFVPHIATRLKPLGTTVRVVSDDLEGLLNSFKRQHPCCKSVTVRLETICIGGEPSCLQRISSFLTSHDMQARRTPNGLEFNAEDLTRAVEIYDRESL
jgi:hypothetical protein